MLFCFLRRTVPYQALGSSIPPFVEVDVRGLELEQVCERVCVGGGV
jgi:hypothetical protein